MEEFLLSLNLYYFLTESYWLSDTIRLSMTFRSSIFFILSLSIQSRGMSFLGWVEEGKELSDTGLTFLSLHKHKQACSECAYAEQSLKGGEKGMGKGERMIYCQLPTKKDTKQQCREGEILHKYICVYSKQMVWKSWRKFDSWCSKSMRVSSK